MPIRNIVSFIFILFASITPLFAQKGLVGEYFNGRNFQEKIMTRIDPTLNFYWDFKAPANGIAPEDFSIRWTGKIVAPETGDYQIGFVVDDGVRMWLNDEKVIDAWDLHDKIFFSNTVRLKEGQSYNIKIEYFNGTREGMIDFKWQRPSKKPFWGGFLGTNEEIIKSNFFTEQKASPVAVENKTTKKIEPKPKKEAPIQKPKPAPKKENLPIAEPTPIKIIEKTPPKDTLAKYIPKNILFQKSTFVMIGNSTQELDNLAKMLFNFPKATLRIEGHSDNIGDAALNQTLSEQRADAVKNYLIQKGIDAKRLTAKGFGSTQPLFKDNLGNPKNRRVAFIVE
jgi:outer membrane protein OmpA-like peptidoglycan-associated protein